MLKVKIHALPNFVTSASKCNLKLNAGLETFIAKMEHQLSKFQHHKQQRT